MLCRSARTDCLVETLAAETLDTGLGTSPRSIERSIRLRHKAVREAAATDHSIGAAIAGWARGAGCKRSVAAAVMALPAPSSSPRVDERLVGVLAVPVSGCGRRLQPGSMDMDMDMDMMDVPLSAPRALAQALYRASDAAHQQHCRKRDTAESFISQHLTQHGRCRRRVILGAFTQWRRLSSEGAQ